jgi:ABC-type transport system involved in multi-copper enzyme maturation permease subunit
MKLLPIVGRELRENSRRRGTYWLRVRVAAQAILIGIAAYVVAAVNPALKLGAGLFWGVAGVSMLFCLLAGRRSTADCVSLEKREGTLGLLFLTDLKGYDVVLGKLAATSVTALYALLAVFPVLLVPLLTGGMTRGEGERMLVVLINTFFLSIAIGVFASAVSREFRTAMAANFSLWLALVCAPAGWGLGLALARSRAPDPAFFYSCPIFSFIASSEAFYAGPAFWATAPRDFWLSIIVTNALAWLLVLLACWIVPRTWGDKPARAPSRRWLWRDLGAWISYGSAAGRRAFRKYALDRNAYFWHAARARFKPVHVWLFLVLGGIWWIVCWAKNGHIWLDEITFIGTAVFLNSTFKFWITLEAGHRLGEDRRSGAFELLLATPLTVPDILRGQWLALRRQFLKPLMVVMVVEVFFAVVLRLSHKRDIVYAMVVFTLMLPIDAAASM